MTLAVGTAIAATVANAQWVTDYRGRAPFSDVTATRQVGTWWSDYYETYIAIVVGPTPIHPDWSYSSYANGVSDSFEIGGYEAANGVHAALWRGYAESIVTLTPTWAAKSWGVATTNVAQVGYAENFDGLIHATLWYGTPSSCIDLNPTGAEESWTTDIDGNIQVGYARFVSGTRGGLWLGSAATWLDLTPAGATTCMVTSVSGDVQGGYSIIGGVRHAGSWQGSANSWVDLNPPGATSSSISCVSGPLKIGYAIFGGVKHVGVWVDSPDSWLDLHPLIGATFNPIESWGVTGFSDGSSFIVHGLVRRPLNTYSAFSWSGPLPNHSFSLTLNKSSVAGENSVLGTITRAQPNTVPSDYLIYDNSSLVLTPGTVALPSLTTSKSFQIKVSPVNSSIAATIYAKQGSSIRSQVLTLLPLVPTALAFTPNPAEGGSVVTGRVVINGVAGPGGRTISLFDNSAYASTPKSVTVPPGANQASFDIQTATVSSAQTVRVTARVSAGEKSGTFRMTP